ncbi:hypothetical protein GGS24DRAFT_515549 [Hypoxylon argillaceum]|nr:hypothetical protein GGS24DRAFT_515549 [Hypoxylon argillaceum]
MASASTKTSETGNTMAAKLISVTRNYYRPVQRWHISEETGEECTKRDGVSRPTYCLFLADDGSYKWVGVNAGVFPGRWSWKAPSYYKRLVFPPFPTGSWNLGQIRRLENGEVAFTKTLELPLMGAENAWHPTKIEFTDFETAVPFDGDCDARLWIAKHPHFDGKSVFVKIALWPSNWSKQAIENETRAYQLIDGLDIAPKFLGHVTYHGAIVGFILELVEGAQTTTKNDENARIEVVNKLHGLGIIHGTAHRKNFLKTGNGVIMIGFEDAKFGDEATVRRKQEDIRRICDENDMTTIVSKEDDDWVPEVSEFFDALVDDEVSSDDSEAGKAETLSRTTKLE